MLLTCGDSITRFSLTAFCSEVSNKIVLLTHTTLPLKVSQAKGAANNDQ